jgi:hypothetical protein
MDVRTDGSDWGRRSAGDDDTGTYDTAPVRYRYDTTDDGHFLFILSFMIISMYRQQIAASEPTK